MGKKKTLDRLDELNNLMNKARDQIAEADKDIKKHGYVCETETGYRYGNPSVNQRKEAMLQMRNLIDMIQEETERREKTQPKIKVMKRER